MVKENLTRLKHQRLMVHDLKLTSVSIDLQFDGKTLNGLSLNDAAMVECKPVQEGKVYQKVRDMVLPYNSFLGISNDLHCLGNKNDPMPFNEI